MSSHFSRVTLQRGRSLLLACHRSTIARLCLFHSHALGNWFAIVYEVFVACHTRGADFGELGIGPRLIEERIIVHGGEKTPGRSVCCSPASRKCPVTILFTLKSWATLRRSTAPSQTDAPTSPPL